MTVKDLKNQLLNYPDDMPVLLSGPIPDIEYTTLRHYTGLFVRRIKERHAKKVANDMYFVAQRPCKESSNYDKVLVIE